MIQSGTNGSEKGNLSARPKLSIVHRQLSIDMLFSQKASGVIVLLWLYILLIVAAVILLPLLIPVGADVSWKDDIIVKLKIAFVPITVYPPKPKKEKPKKKKKKEPEKKPKEEKPKEKEPGILKQKGLSWLIDFIERAAQLATGALKFFFGRIIIKKLMLSIRVAGEDAAETAVNYGKTCAAVYPALGIIMGVVRHRRYGVEIAPDFEENAKTQISLELKARILVLWLVALVLKYGIKGIRLMLEFKEK